MKKESTKSNPGNKITKKEPKESYEKSVIKDIESSRLRIKPWILQLIGTVFIILGLFFVFYPFFSDRVSINFPDFIKDNQENQEKNEEKAQDDRDTKDKENQDDEGSIAGGESIRRDTASTPTGLKRAQTTAEKISQTGVWRATDYKKGDITTGTYQVQLGDTLWEIAEAVYGDGSQWNKLLETNPTSIGFLPDGSQALITAGQFLTIS